MEEHSESIQVADVERAKVCMEGIVEEGIINREVDRASSLAGRARLGPTFARGLGSVLRERERGPRVGRRAIRREIQTI